MSLSIGPVRQRNSVLLKGVLRLTNGAFTIHHSLFTIHYMSTIKHDKYAIKKSNT
jgi:hypothetical protein